MNIIETPISDLLVIEPKVFEDKRGYFFESYNKEKYTKAGIRNDFVQDNESKSTKGVLRGLHYQTGEFAQAKLVRVTQGKVWDVAVDMRAQSPTFKQWFGIELSEQNKKQFLIPRGFAHGFLVLSDTAVFNYKCDQYYAPEFEGGVRFDDEELNIDWPLSPEQFIVSEKDLNLPELENAQLF